MVVTGELLAVVMLCRYRGTWQVMAVLVGIDLLLLIPFDVVWRVANGEPVRYPALQSVWWRLPTYLGCGVLLVALLRRWPLPEWMLPVKGIWARRLLAFAAIFGLAAVLLAEAFLALWQRSTVSGGIPWLPWLILALLLAYAAPLGDVLVRGWNYRRDCVTQKQASSL